MDWTAPLAGGLMIGAAALLLYATLGRIAGISGIAYGALSPSRGDRGWRLTFLAGLLGGGLLAVGAGLTLPVVSTHWTAPLTVAGGLLVGVGTRLGNGCTSGHGVCGIARLSPRSLVSVAVFMAIGIAVATLLRPALVGGTP